MELGLALTLCSLGGAFWVASLVLFLIMTRRKRNCTAQTKALVTEIKTRSSSNGFSYHPVYEYEVEGVSYSGLGAYISRRVPKIGTTIVIRYNPRSPKKSYIPGYDDRLMKILSAVFAAVGCVPVLICVCIGIFA